MSKSLFSLEGKTALITGSSEGLGLVFARGLAEAGARVILNGRKADKLDTAVCELKKDGLDASGSVFDVTNFEGIEAAVAAIEKESGTIDILVNNVGLQRRAPLHEITLEAWQEVLNTNLTSAFMVSKCVVKGMIERKRGKIINTCSLMSFLGRQTTGPYTSAKGGLKMMTQAMCVDWARYDIQINGIAPGYFITEMTKPLALNKEFNDWLCNRTPARRWGRPEELIGALVLLASEAGSFINGQIIVVDGGIKASL
jgi:gluconate 5-dehydrogenase